MEHLWKRLLCRSKHFLREYRFLLFSLSIGIAVIFSLFIIGDKPFFLNQDQMRQYEIFYQEWLRLLNVFVKTGEAPFYSWNLFLGSDFLISKFYYVTGDPFVLLFALLPFSVHRFLILESIFCVYIAGCLFYWFLKEFGITNKSVRITTALLYAFSGFTVHYYGNFMFFRFFAFLPLLFVGVERYLQKKQTGIFIFAVLLLIFQSYYFMFPTSFFLVFYVLFSYLHRGNRFDFRKIIKLALPLIGAYLIGILLSMVFLLPTIMMVLQNTRLGVVSEATGLFWSFKTILGYLFSLITPPFNIWTWYYPYIFTEGYGYAFWCSLYTSAFAVIALFWQLLYGKQKKLFRIFLGVLFAFMVVLPLNSMLHGFSEPSSRWFFLVVLFLCLIFAITMQEFKNIDTKQLIHSYGLFTFLILLGFILLNLFKQIDYSIHGSNILGFTIPLLLGWLYVFLLHKKLKRIVYILAVAEAVVGCMLTASVTTLGNQMPVNQIEPAFFMSLQEQDSESAFRIYIDSIFYQPYSSLNLNQPLKLGYMGTSTYDTIYAFELNDFLHLNGFYQHFIELKDIEVLKMLGVKYYLVSSVEELPEGVEFTKVDEYHQFSVYEISNYNHIGFTYSSFELYSEELTEFHDWNQVLLVEEDLYQQVQSFSKQDSIQFHVYNRTINTLSGTISTEADTVLFLSIPYNEGWRIYDNDEQVDYFKVQGGFIGIVLAPGNHTITMQYIPEYLYTGAFISGLAAVLWIGVVLIRKRIKSQPAGQSDCAIME